MNEWILFIQVFVFLLIIHILSSHIRMEKTYMFDMKRGGFISYQPVSPKEELLQYVKQLQQIPQTKEVHKIIPEDINRKVQEPMTNGNGNNGNGNGGSSNSNKPPTRIQGIIPSNVYEDSYNEVNMPPNVSALPRMYKHQPFDGRTGEELLNIANVQTTTREFMSNDFGNRKMTNRDQYTDHQKQVTAKHQSSSPSATWNYENDFVMNGGPFVSKAPNAPHGLHGTGLMGYDTSSGAYASYAPLWEEKCDPKKKQLVPSSQVDDLRPSMGATMRKEYIMSYQ
jgi:hypothetical protein